MLEGTNHTFVTGNDGCVQDKDVEQSNKRNASLKKQAHEHLKKQKDELTALKAEVATLTAQLFNKVGAPAVTGGVSGMYVWGQTLRRL